MTYFEDLSDYRYDRTATERPVEKNIGWLGLGHEFERLKPSEEVLDQLWKLCTVSVSPSRGFHQCEFCDRADVNIVERNGKRLKLGTAEIRVFSGSGVIYAAPNLIYHYVSVHHYRPPNEFISALIEGPLPPMPEYFEELRKQNREWEDTYAPDADWDAAMERLRRLHKPPSSCCP